MSYKNVCTFSCDFMKFSFSWKNREFRNGIFMTETESLQNKDGAKIK